MNINKLRDQFKNALQNPERYMPHQEDEVHHLLLAGRRAEFDLEHAGVSDAEEVIKQLTRDVVAECQVSSALAYEFVINFINNLTKRSPRTLEVLAWRAQFMMGQSLAL